MEESKLLGSQIAVHVKVIAPVDLPHHLHIGVAEMVVIEDLGQGCEPWRKWRKLLPIPLLPEGEPIPWGACARW